MKSGKSADMKSKALKIAGWVSGQKATDPVVLDVEKLTNLCEYFVICSAQTNRQVQAIYEEVLKKAGEENIDVHHRDVDMESTWAMVDFFDVVVHVFLEETRTFYNLEYLWRDAKKIPLKRPAKKK